MKEEDVVEEQVEEEVEGEEDRAGRRKDVAEEKGRQPGCRMLPVVRFFWGRLLRRAWRLRVSVSVSVRAYPGGLSV